MNLLIVKLSSLGDVVHAMPAVQDLRALVPGIAVDWVVERAFAPLVERCEGVSRVIPCELRQWRRAPLSRATRVQWRAFRRELQAQRYDAVIDLQGLTKSALVARSAALAPGGRRIAMANRTQGSSYEVPTRWVADLAVPVEPRSHAVQRARDVCAAAFGYAVPPTTHYGLRAQAAAAADRPSVAFVHGSSRQDKCWPIQHWVSLGRWLAEQGYAIGLPHGSDAELRCAEELATGIGLAAEIWPRLDLGALTDRLAGCAGVIGVDSGLSHIAVALDLPHVQLYNFDTAWRTGPPGGRQRSVYGSPCPPPEAVRQAWQGALAAS